MSDLVRLFNEDRNEHQRGEVGSSVPTTFGLTVPPRQTNLYERVVELLERLSSADRNRIAAMLTLLDDEAESTHAAIREAGMKRPAFASTQEIIQVWIDTYAIPFGGTAGNREIRDQTTDPLFMLGLVERVSIPNAATRRALGKVVVEGWPVPTGNTGYRASTEARALLIDTPDEDWPDALGRFVAGSELRRQKADEARLSAGVGSVHNALIELAVQAHLEQPALAGFGLLYGDLSGDRRLSDEDEERLAAVGITFKSGDRYPDSLLANHDKHLLWIIEAVESDGEVDDGRRRQMLAHYEDRCGWKVAGFTTAYEKWQKASGRQGKMRNLAVDTWLWIRQDGGKFFRVERELSLDPRADDDR